jgi:hypothetical protein
MNEENFYSEIEHSEVPWRQYRLHVPVFYQDIRFMSVSIIAPVKRILDILPSNRLKPYRITPWNAALSITAYQYRESDLGPYNEVSISIPVTMDDETPLFTGSLRKTPKVPLTYSLHLPVTTEIAREVGVDFAGYPKFIADIGFTEAANWWTCELSADGKNVLKLSGRVLNTGQVPRYRVNPITFRRGYLLRSEFVISERKMGDSRRKEDVKLELGDHPISDELRDLKLGRVLGYQFCPQAQGILTPVFESFAAN